MSEAHKAFLFASGFEGRGETLDHGIKYSQGLGEDEIAAIDDVLRVFLARTSLRGEEFRLALSQSKGAELGVRARRGVDHEGRPNWILFGVVRGTPRGDAGWIARKIEEPLESDAVPCPPEPSSGDPRYLSFWGEARDRGRPWRMGPPESSHALDASMRERPARRVWLVAAAILVAAVVPWRFGQPESDDAESAQREQVVPALDPGAAALQELRAFVLRERKALAGELSFLVAESFWRFGRSGEPEVEDADAAGLQRACRALRESVESASDLAPLELRSRYWPRDGRAAPIDPILVLLGPRTLDDARLAKVRAWIDLFALMRDACMAAG